MKPCSQNRKIIALLVLEELEAPHKQNIQAHLNQCPGCQAYFDELAGIAGALMSRKSLPPVEATQQFHASLLRQLRGTSHRFSWLDLLRHYRFGLANRRIVLPVLGTAALALVALLAMFRPAAVPPQPVPNYEVASHQNLKTNIDPTISNYRMAAEQSFEKFDQMLTEQGSKNLSTTAIYTAAAKPLEIGPD